MKNKKIFGSNQPKSANKVTINSFMMGSLFFVLTMIVILETQSSEKFSQAITFQLFLAIPLLYVSSLAYSKIGYWQETNDWNALGWFTNTTGNLFVINAIGLLANKLEPSLSYAYFLLFCALMIIYTAINIKHNKDIWLHKVFKLLYLLGIIFVGGIMFIQWVQ